MKVLKDALKLAAILALMGSFTFTPSGMAIAEEKKAEAAEESEEKKEEAKSEEAKSDDAKPAEADAKAKGKKKGKGGKEPDCE